MSRWTCPGCDREFGRANQSHVCVPGCTVDECFAGRNPVQREIYDLIIEHLQALGPVHIDAVQVGVLLKHERKLAELRPKARSLELSLVLPHDLRDARIARSIRTSADTVAHFIKLTTVDQVDDTLRDWLSEAYDYAG